MRTWLSIVFYISVGIGMVFSNDTLYHQVVRHSLSPFSFSKKGTITITEDEIIFRSKKEVEEADFRFDLDSIESVKRAGYFIFFYTRHVWPNMISIHLKGTDKAIRLFCFRRKKLIRAIESQILEAT